MLSKEPERVYVSFDEASIRQLPEGYYGTDIEDFMVWGRAISLKKPLPLSKPKPSWRETGGSYSGIRWQHPCRWYAATTSGATASAARSKEDVPRGDMRTNKYVLTMIMTCAWVYTTPTLIAHLVSIWVTRHRHELHQRFPISSTTLKAEFCGTRSSISREAPTRFACCHNKFGSETEDAGFVRVSCFEAIYSG